jgi:hypothetical protein
MNQRITLNDQLLSQFRIREIFFLSNIHKELSIALILFWDKEFGGDFASFNSFDGDVEACGFVEIVNFTNWLDDNIRLLYFTEQESWIKPF